MSRLAFFMVFVGSLWAGQGHAENPMILYRQAECMRDHADDYLAFVDSFTLVFPGFCEDGLYNPTPAEVAKGTSQNSSGSIAASSIIEFTPQDQAANAQLSKLSKNAKATAILVTAEMVACLKDRFDDVSLKHKFRTTREESVDVAELIFELCR